MYENKNNNQTFFSKFDTVENKPWINRNGLFLLNCITEACSELWFHSENKEMTAKWKINLLNSQN